jgi:hypothetical protein
MTPDAMSMPHRPRAGLAVLLACVCALSARAVLADQPRDYMLDFQPTGTFVLADYYGTGGLLTLEHRARIYGSSNDITVAGGLVPAYPLGEAFARADLRILFLGIGVTAAYRTVWRDLKFEPGDHGEYCKNCDREARRKMDPLFGKSPGSEAFGWGEARATLYFPFNEHVIGTTTGALRYEGRDDRSYDWFYTSVYDGGVIGRWEAQLFLKDRDWGGIGPYVQLLSLPRAGEHDAQWAFGFNAVTRLGLLHADDLLFLTFLIRPGDGIYGQHNYFSPIRSLLIYRMSFQL